MIFLACEMDVGLLKVIVFIKQLLGILFILVPIILIIILMVDLAKNVMAGGEDDQKKNMQIALKRVVYCIALFFVPFIVKLAMKIMDDVFDSLDISTKYTSCYNVTTKELEGMALKQCTEAKGVYDQTTGVCETKATNNVTGESISGKVDKKSYCQSGVVEAAIREGAKRVCYYYNDKKQKDNSDKKYYRYFGYIAEYDKESEDPYYQIYVSDGVFNHNIDISDIKDKNDGTSSAFQLGQGINDNFYLSGPAKKSLISGGCPSYMYVETTNANSVCFCNSHGLSNTYCNTNNNTENEEDMTYYPKVVECKGNT